MENVLPFSTLYSRFIQDPYIYIYVVFLGSMFDSGGRSVFFTHCGVHVDAC